jgi:small nuclear ribonucleoprotein G
MLTILQVYLNIVLDDALEEKPGGEKVRIGMVVIRGNAVVMLEVRVSARSFI